MKIRKGFTMIELMIVILVIAVLAAIAIPMMTKRMEYAKWSEAEGTMAQLANDARTFAEKWGRTHTGLAQLGYTNGVGLQGQYFQGPTVYGVTNTYTDRENMAIVVTCDNGAVNTATNKPRTDVGPQHRTLTTTIASGNATSVWTE